MTQPGQRRPGTLAARPFTPVAAAASRPHPKHWVFSTLAIVHLACCGFSVLLEYGHVVPRGILTDWFCQMLPPVLFAPAAAALLAWGLARFSTYRWETLLPAASVALLTTMAPQILFGGFCLITGFRPGGG